jgi:hypothetical protein
MRDGTKGEVAIVSALRPYYPMAERRAKEGYRDRGDIGGVAPHVVIEAKHCPKSYRISEWLKEADREGINDRADLACVWFKLKGTADPLDWPVMMRGRFFIPLLQLWTAGREPAENTNNLKLF